MLDGQGQTRVIHIESSASEVTIELIGLNVTGGKSTSDVSRNCPYLSPSLSHRTCCLWGRLCCTTAMPLRPVPPHLVMAYI